jgi:hypothetical protein
MLKYLTQIQIAYIKIVILQQNISTTQDNELIKIVKYYLPNQLAIGKYYIVYSVNSTNTDYNTRNNFAIDSFEVSGFPICFRIKCNEWY